MLKTILVIVIVIVVGSLLGNLLRDFLLQQFSSGFIFDFVSKEVSAGLDPTRLDLRVIDFTFGAKIRVNFPSALGILASGLLAKIIIR